MKTRGVCKGFLTGLCSLSSAWAPRVSTIKKACVILFAEDTASALCVSTTVSPSVICTISLKRDCSRGGWTAHCPIENETVGFCEERHLLK